MSVVFLLLFDSWQVLYGRAVLEELHSYDLRRCEVVATPAEAGLDVDCLLRLRVTRSGPLRFFLSPEVGDLQAERDGQPIEATLGAGAYGKVLELIGRNVQGVPALLTLRPEPPPRAGEELSVRLRYRWRPSGDGFAYAAGGAVQTHLASFWVPTMAGEFFEASLEVRGDTRAIASGESRDGRPVQLLCLVAGDFRVARRKTGGRVLEVFWPPGLKMDAEEVLDDLAAVLERLEDWFGPALGIRFRLVVEPRDRPAPSYCAGSFVVLDRRFLPDRIERSRWLAHLAHECSHVWWGHKVAGPVVGGGGTWIREGLAQWSGIKVAGALLGEEAERDLFRACVRGYLGRRDLRGKEGIVFANEPTLLDATYLDDLAVSYLRGALVHRRIEHLLGAEAYRNALRRFAERHAYRFSTAADYAEAVGAIETVAYYAATTRLPDFAMRDREVGDGRFEVEVYCLDPEWPDGPVPCLLETTKGKERLVVDTRGGSGRLVWRGEGVPVRFEIDPERTLLDPVRSNSVWPR